MNVEAEIEKIKERNRRVEADKAWETSLFRTVTISVLTYVVAAAFLYVVGVQQFLLSAVVPALGFFLSTQSLPAIKDWWLKNRHAR